MTGVLEQARYSAAFLRRLDTRNLGMLRNTLAILTRASARNWYYNRELAIRELPRAAVNFALDPDGMNDFQRHSPISGYTSSPEDGILAGVTDRGRLSTLFYPHTGFTQQVPYFETGTGLLNGAKPREGAFFGVRTADGDGVTWLWEPAFEHTMSPRQGTGTLDLAYEPLGDAPAEASEAIYALPGAETIARDLAVRAERPIEGLVYYMQANANARLQYPPGVTSPNRAVARERAIEWRDRESDVGLRLAADPDTDVRATGVAEGALDDLFDAARPAVEGHYVGGYLAFDVTLEPGEEAAVSVFTSGIDGGRDDRLDRDADRRQSIAADRWDGYLADVPVGAVPDRFAEQYERSVVAMLMLYDPASGSLSAAPNLQPAYYPSWPRDGSFVAIALAEAGNAAVATDYLARFLGGVQEPDGGFEQCYASNGAPAGIIPRENDQQAIYVHAVREVYDLTGDDEFLADAWPTVRGALEYTIDAIADNGLLEATPDFAEMWADARQSLWTNAFAYRALLDGAYLAAERGEDGTRYRRAAERVGDAIERCFFEGREAFATELTVLGAERDENVAFSAAVHPTGWAGAYGRADELIGAFTDVYRAREQYWLPKEFIYAAALYDRGRTELGDRVLEKLQGETLPGGTLAEEVDAAGEHSFAALGWANAGFVHALHVRARAEE